ncbi:epimerase [Paenibacillus alba]|uniref:epimerase n=1 Tax=Paenibacillus alba TaxID=1197127 RepID=UPI00156432D6|nr:epimerase [Paenibacillus alba]NQX66687.1 epimerase [Paenibacillus alba]
MNTHTKVRTILTGATGMVGEGVLLECLNQPDVEQVLVINRKPCGVTHPKLTELIVKNFFDLSAIEDELVGYNACFFCLGVSSVGMKEEAYTEVTYKLTLHVAKTLVRLNPDMVFCYVTGAGTDSTEQGKSMWARVKGKTENELLKLPFRKAYMFRPGYIKPTKGQKNVHPFIFWLAPFEPLFKLFLSSYMSTVKDIALAMIHTVTIGSEKPILDVKDMNQLAKAK